MSDSTEKGGGSSGAGVAVTAGAGLLAVLAGLGKVVVNQGDDVVRVAARSGDDLMSGAGSALRSADDAALSGRFAGSLDDAGRPLGSAADDVSLALGRAGAHPWDPTLGDDLARTADDIANQESRVSGTLGSLADPAEARAPRVKKPADAAAAKIPGSKANPNAAALRDLLERTARGRKQLAEQMEALRRLQAGTQGVEPQIVEQVAARQHERALKSLENVHTTVAAADKAELVRAVEIPRPIAALQQQTIASSTPARDSFLSQLSEKARGLAKDRGGHFLKELLEFGAKRYLGDDSADDKKQGPVSNIPQLLKDATANQRRLSEMEVVALRQELGQTLSRADRELSTLAAEWSQPRQGFVAPGSGGITYYSGATTAKNRLAIEHAARITLIRLETYYAAQAAERFAAQLGQDTYVSGSGIKN